MRVLPGVMIAALVSTSVTVVSGCSTTGASSSRVYHGGGYRTYHGGPWGGYHPPVYIIDDEIDRPEAEQLPEFGPPDFDMGGMDGGFDAFDF